MCLLFVLDADASLPIGLKISVQMEAGLEARCGCQEIASLGGISLAALLVYVCEQRLERSMIRTASRLTPSNT
jgi:hypothetical protein